REVRGLAPFPGAWFELGAYERRERVKLLLAETIDASGAPGAVLDDAMAIACGSGAIRPVRLQRAGKPAMDRADFMRGHPIEQGSILA
ncbi:MAG: methionyl-tRNA formyltransferase, partial [Pseudomonadota bacterium]